MTRTDIRNGALVAVLLLPVPLYGVEIVKAFFQVIVWLGGGA